MSERLTPEEWTVNTDRELWRRTPGDYYSPSIHVTAGGAIGINVGGHVIVQSVEAWHALRAERDALAADHTHYAQRMNRALDERDAAVKEADVSYRALVSCLNYIRLHDWPAPLLPLDVAEAIRARTPPAAGDQCPVCDGAGKHRFPYGYLSDPCGTCKGSGKRPPAGAATPRPA